MKQVALHVACALAAVGAFAAPAAAQSYNIDFGTAGTSPPATYGGAGLAGRWNVLGVPTPGTYYPLVDLQSVAHGVTLNNLGGTQVLTVNDPATSGADEQLMDDMLIGFNNPVDVCIWINNLPNGPYEVTIYAMTPSNSDLYSRTRVDYADDVTPIYVGGAWPGYHAPEVTYSKFTVNVFNGKIGLHSGLYGGNMQSGINGIQIRPIVLGDLNGDSTVDGADLGILLGQWGPCAGCSADFNQDGAVDGADLGVLLAEWS